MEDSSDGRELSRNEDIIRPARLWPNNVREYASSSDSASHCERNDDELERRGRSGPS